MFVKTIDKSANVVYTEDITTVSGVLLSICLEEDHFNEKEETFIITSYGGTLHECTSCGFRGGD